MRPAYFIVALINGRPVPAIYWDELPHAPIRHLQYVVRLDEGETEFAMIWLMQGEPPLLVAELYAAYLQMKRAGTLPPQWQPPPRPAAPAAQILAGHREDHWPRRPLPDTPYEP